MGCSYGVRPARVAGAKVLWERFYAHTPQIQSIGVPAGLDMRRALCVPIAVQLTCMGEILGLLVCKEAEQSVAVRSNKGRSSAPMVRIRVIVLAMAVVNHSKNMGYQRVKPH